MEGEEVKEGRDEERGGGVGKEEMKSDGGVREEEEEV